MVIFVCRNTQLIRRSGQQPPVLMELALKQFVPVFLYFERLQPVTMQRTPSLGVSLAVSL